MRCGKNVEPLFKNRVCPALLSKLVIRGTLNILRVYVEFRRGHSVRGLSNDFRKEYTLRLTPIWTMPWRPCSLWPRRWSLTGSGKPGSCHVAPIRVLERGTLPYV